jgi:hypothetical protein
VEHLPDKQAVGVEYPCDPMIHGCKSNHIPKGFKRELKSVGFEDLLCRIRFI